MGGTPPFSQAERTELREVAKDIINGGRVTSWNREPAKTWAPLVTAAVLCLGRESAELLSLPFSGGFVEQPQRTMQAVGVIQQVFSERLKAEYEKKRKGSK